MKKVHKQVRDFADRVAADSKAVVGKSASVIQQKVVDVSATFSDWAVEHKATLSKRIVGARNLTADATEGTVQFAGKVAGVSGEVALLSLTGGLT